MVAIMLNEEQSAVLAQAPGPILVQDRDGRIIARIDPEDQFDEYGVNLTEIRRQSARDRRTLPGVLVQAHLQALQKAADEGASDEELHELSERLIDRAFE